MLLGEPVLYLGNNKTRRHSKHSVTKASNTSLSISLILGPSEETSKAMHKRTLTPLDTVICNIDRAIRTLTGNTQEATRSCPKSTPDAELNDKTSDKKLSDKERKHSAGLMRVNHSGEVCAQALYQGQALTAKLPEVRQEMEQAADEEIDHLAWCEKRLTELNSRPSAFNPLWYSLSFGLGAGAGLISDKMSLGFVAATEEQVCRHLSEHLEKLPPSDQASRAILEQMRIDEEQHGHNAIAAGGYRFPKAVKAGMTSVSKVMTSLSYRI